MRRGENRGQPGWFVSTNIVFSGAEWQLGGRQAAGVTGAKPHRRSNWHDCCLPASERSGKLNCLNP